MLFKHKMAAPECDQSPCGTGMSYLKPSYDRTANIVHRAEFGAAQGDDLGTNKVRTSLVGYVWLLYYLFPCSLAPYLVPRSLSLLLRKSFRRECSQNLCDREQRHRYTPPPGTVWLFGDNCDTCSLKPHIVFWATWHPWRKRMVYFLPARTMRSEEQNIPHSGKMHAWE